MRAVLDTVILVRALINPRGPSGLLLGELQHLYTIVLSPEIIREIMDVTHRSSLEGKLGVRGDGPQADSVLALIQAADVVVPTEPLDASRDPSDNKFFECAVASSANYIVSEDRDILDVGEFEGIQVVRAHQFVEILRTTLGD